MYGDIATSIRIENVLRVYDSEDKKIDIIDNFNKFGVKCVQGFRFLSCIYRVRYCVKFL